MPQVTTQNGSSQWTTVSGSTILVYALNPTLLAEFAVFYKKTIMPWLKERSVTGSAMVVGHTLFAVVSNSNPPWTGTAGIPNFAQFVAHKAPVIEPLPDVLLS